MKSAVDDSPEVGLQFLRKHYVLAVLSYYTTNLKSCPNVIINFTQNEIFFLKFKI